MPKPMPKQLTIAGLLEGDEQYNQGWVKLLWLSAFFALFAVFCVLRKGKSSA